MSAAVVGPTLPGRSTASGFTTGRLGAVQKHQQRVMAERLLPGRGRVLLVVGVIDGDGGIDIEVQPLPGAGGHRQPTCGPWLERGRHGSRADERRRSGRRPVGHFVVERRAEDVARSLQLRPRRRCSPRCRRGAGQVGEPRRGMSPRALGSGRDGRDLPEAQRIRSWPPPQRPPGRAFADVSGLDRDYAGGADARRSSLLFAGGTAVSWSPQITRVDASMQPRMDAGVTLPVEDDPSTNPEHELPAITLAPP